MNVQMASIKRFQRLVTCLALIIVIGSLPLTAFADGDAAPPAGAMISIPSLSLNAEIVTIPLDARLGTWNTNDLGMSVGHFQHTPWLGESGNIVLGGHSTLDDGSPSIFYHLDNISVGDELSLTANSEAHRYVVTRVRLVPINDLSVLYPTRNDIVTLITCAGFNGETGVYEQRLVVTARRAD